MADFYFGSPDLQYRTPEVGFPSCEIEMDKLKRLSEEANSNGKQGVFGKLRPRKRRPKTSKTKTSKTKTSKTKTSKAKASKTRVSYNFCHLNTNFLYQHV